MTRSVRIILAILFFLAFVVTAPIVLLLTSGYRIDWQHHRVQRTGSLLVETQPAGAQVALNGAPQRRLTPAAYSRLLPDEYLVQVQKQGYLPWEKRLTVRSGQTTFANHLTLYRDALPRLLVNREIDAAAWSPDATDLAYLANDGAWKELLVTLDGREPSLLGRFAADAYDDAAIEWSAAGDALLFAGTAGGATHLLAYAPQTSSAAVAIHDAFPKGSLTGHWLEDGTVAVVSADGAFRVNPLGGEATPIVLGDDIADVTVADRTAYVVRDAQPGGTASVDRVESDGSLSTLATLRAGEYRFLSGAGRILLLAEKRRGDVVRLDVPTGNSAAFAATGAAWEPDGDRLLLWNDFEIAIVGQDGDRELLTRLGTPIGQCAWSPDKNAVLFSTAGGVSAIELDDRDHRVTTELIRFSSVGRFAVDGAARMLRFVGAVGNQHGAYEREL